MKADSETAVDEIIVYELYTLDLRNCLHATNDVAAPTIGNAH